MRISAMALAACAFLLVGCGGDGGTSPESEEARAAQVVNDFAAAGAAGDGDLACSYLSKRAQGLILRRGPGAAASCAEFFDRPDGAADAPTFTSTDVRLDEFRGAPSATVSDPYGGQMLLLNHDGEWLIEIPGFVK